MLQWLFANIFLQILKSPTRLFSTYLKTNRISCALYLFCLASIFLPMPFLRRARPADLDLVILLGTQAFSEAFSEFNTAQDMELYLSQAYAPVTIAAELADATQPVYIWEEEKTPMGFYKLRLGRGGTHFLEGKPAELQRIYLLKALYGSGRGSRMLIPAEVQAAAAGYDWLWLGVWEKNEAARRLYERHGFEAFGQHDFLLGTDLQRDVLMRKRISAS